MLIHRTALQVVRLCNKPDDDVAPVTTHVFFDDSGRIAATNGFAVLRINGLVKQKPDLFMEDVLGVDELSKHTLPGELVADFLKSWEGDQVVVRDHKKGSLLETVDGQTSRVFESKTVLLDPPKFESVIKAPKAARRVMVSVEQLVLIARTLKAAGAVAVTLSIGDDPTKAIHLSAKIDPEGPMEERIDGALMPMRE